MAAEEAVQEFYLREDNELRFVAGEEADVCLELVSGYAEIFGTELLLNKKYIFPAKTRVAVFTWKTAKVEIIGVTESAYIAESTPMVIYLNIHAAMEEIRKKKEVSAVGGSKPMGPKILLVGPTDVGKTTLARVLCNYSVRHGRTPIYVELDVGQNNISVPGSIGAMMIEKTADVNDGFERNLPIVYNFGHTSPAGNLSLYNELLQALSETINEQIKLNDEACIGGMVINTCGWVDGDGYRCIINAASAFEVDVVVVLDHERLYSDLGKELPEFVRLTHVPKSGGVEQRSSQVRTFARKMNIHRYFYGTRSNTLFPFNYDISFSDCILCKIGTEQLPDSCLPFGMEAENHELKMVIIQPSIDIKNHMLALSRSAKADESVVTTSVYGFVLVTDIDMENKTMSVLCTQGSLPTKIFVYTEVTHIDDQLQR